MKRFLIFFLLIFSALQIFASSPDDILGVWATSSNKAHIQIFKLKGKYYGKIIWLKNPNDPITGTPKVDKRNPVAGLRNQSILGLVVLRDFKYNNDEWTAGKIYNPEDGKEYKSYIKLNKNELSVRGYVGISLLGKTEKFVRVK